MAKFLGKTLTEEQLTRLTEHLKIASFEKNESVNLEDVRRDGVAFNNTKLDVKVRPQRQNWRLEESFRS